MRAQTVRKCEIFIAGIVIQFVSVGFGYGYSVMFPVLVNVLNTTRFAASFVQGIYLIMTFCGGIMWSSIIHKFGTGPTTICGIILAAAGLIISSFASHIEEIIAFAGVICGLGMSVCYLSTFISVSEAFKEDPRLFLTSLTIGASFGHIGVPMLFEIVIAKYFWSGAFILLSGFVLQCMPFGILLYLRTRPEEEEKIEDARPVVCDVIVLKDLVLCNVLVNVFLMFLTGNIEALLIVDQLIGLNIPRNKGSVLVSITGISAVLGRILASILVFKCTRWPMVYHWIYVSIAIAIGHVLVLGLLNVYTFLVLACFLRGAAFGIFNALVPTVVYEAAGSEKYPAAMAFANIAIGFGDFLCCILGGIVRDVMGSYDFAYNVATGIAVYVTLSSLFISCRIRQNEGRMNNELTKDISSKLSYSTLE